MIRKKEKSAEWLEYESIPDVIAATSIRGSFRAAFPITKFATANQVHGEVVTVVEKEGVYDSCDALITNALDLGLIIRHADCQAAIFYDPVTKAFGNAHCGWRGSVLNIYAKVVEAMGREYGTKPQDLYVAISPSLGPKNAEFINYRKELPKSFYPFRRGENHFDFWGISRAQLEECGVKNIEIAGLCTFENSKDFYSYRRDKTSGRHETLVAKTKKRDMM